MVKCKRKTSEDSGSGKKRQAISMETKVAIIKKLDSGEKMVNVARKYSMNRSTIGTIYKNKDRIMEHVKSTVPMQSTIISKKRGKLMEEMETLLGDWIEHQRQRKAPLSLMLIQEKAKSLFDDLKAKASKNAADATFSASYGWFHRFKKRANLHQVPVSVEEESADLTATEKFPDTLMEIVEKEGYTHQQVFIIEALTNEDLMELDKMQKTEEYKEEEAPFPLKKFETKLLAKGFSLIEKALNVLESQDPNVERFSKVATAINDAIQCYRLIYDEKKRKSVQTSLDQFFKPVPSTSKASPTRLTDSSADEEESFAEETLAKEDTDFDDPLPL